MKALFSQLVLQETNQPCRESLLPLECPEDCRQFVNEDNFYSGERITFCPFIVTANVAELPAPKSVTVQLFRVLFSGHGQG